MPTALDRAKDKYNYANWNAQEQQTRQQFSNDTQTLGQSTWNNAAATGNTRGSYNQFAYNQQYQPLQQNLNNTIGQISQQRALYKAQVKSRNAAEAAAARIKKLRAGYINTVINGDASSPAYKEAYNRLQYGYYGALPINKT